MNYFNELVVFFAEDFPYFVAMLFVVFVFSRFALHRARVLLFCEGFGAALVSRGFVEMIRVFVHRPRPFVADSSIVPLFSETSFSFPSGHAAFFFALSTVVFFYNKQWGLVFFIAGLFIGAARVLAGVHYPSDILGGALLGIVVGYLVPFAFCFFQKKSS